MGDYYNKKIIKTNSSIKPSKIPKEVNIPKEIKLRHNFSMYECTKRERGETNNELDNHFLNNREPKLLQSNVKEDSEKDLQQMKENPPDIKVVQDEPLEQEISGSCSKGRGRGRKRMSSANTIEPPIKPCFLKVNPYVVSPQNALDLMAKICSAEPSANRIKWLKEIEKILDDYNFQDVIKNHRSLLYNPTFDKDLFYSFNSLTFAMDNESFGNRPRVRIAVAGLFTAGKSSLLNYLVQQPNLLPENPNPSTVVPAYLYCRKDIEENHIFGVNQYRALIQLDESAINGIEHNNVEGKDGAIQKGASEQIATALHHFIVEIPHQNFDKMVFVDTPGYGNPGSRDNRIATECIKNADMLVYLVDCNNGSLKDDELKILDSYSKYNNRPIVVIITRNDLCKGGAESVFRLISSQVSSMSLVKDVICLSVRPNTNYWSRSGLSLEKSLQEVAKSARCSTDINKIWNIIESLFNNERSHLEKQLTWLQTNRLEIINAKIELEKDIDHRLKFIPEKVESALTSNAILCEDDTLLRLKRLTRYYEENSEENIERHKKIINLYDKKIKESEKIRGVLKKIIEKLSWWKSDTVKQMHSVKYAQCQVRESNSIFDAIDDMSDITLSKLIDSLIDGCDITTNYNNDGFSVLTYSAYCGNLSSLIFILDRISERYAFMRDKKMRNIMHAAAEGLQINTLQFLKKKYPDYISLKDSQGKNCDEIYIETLKCKIDKYEN